MPSRRKARQLLAVASATAGAAAATAVPSPGPPAGSMAATEALASSLRSFLVGDQQQLLQQLSDAVVLAPSALAQVDTSLLSEWARQADEGAQAMTALRDRLLQAHGETIAGRVKAALHAEAPNSAADDTAADRCCGGEDSSTGRDAAGGGLPDISTAGPSGMAVDKPACPVEPVAIDNGSTAKAATARLPSSGLQQLPLQRLKHASFPEAAQAVGHATDLQAAAGQQHRGLQPAGPVEADTATGEEAAVKADAQQRPQKQHQAAKCALKRKRTGKGLHGQQTHGPVRVGQGVRADSADQATQQSAAPAELVGIASAVSMISCHATQPAGRHGSCNAVTLHCHCTLLLSHPVLHAHLRGFRLSWTVLTLCIAHMISLVTLSVHLQCTLFQRSSMQNSSGRMCRPNVV